MGARKDVLGGVKQRTVLVEFLLAHGRVVSDGRLSALLWAEAPPATASAQIYTYVSRLRKLFDPALEITRYPYGYLMKLGDAWCDHVEFERLSRAGLEALEEERWQTAADRLREALALWRGQAMADVTDHLALSERPLLDEARITALEGRVAADLVLGRHPALIAELTGLVAEQPLRERLRAQLMTALYRCDRQADAIAIYHEGRCVLAEEYGVDPGPVLSATYQAMLTGDLRFSQSPVTPDGTAGGVRACRRVVTASRRVGCAKASHASRPGTRLRNGSGHRPVPITSAIIRRTVRSETPSRLAAASSVSPSARIRSSSYCWRVNPSGLGSGGSPSGMAVSHTWSKRESRAVTTPAPSSWRAPWRLWSGSTGTMATLRSKMIMRGGRTGTVRTWTPDDTSQFR